MARGMALDEMEVKPKPAPQVTVKKVTIIQGKDPALTAEAIERKIDTSTAISCYSKALTSKPKLAGTMTIKLTIDAQGKVTAIEVVKDTTKEKGLMICVRDALKALSFSAPTTSTRVVATVVLEFKP